MDEKTKSGFSRKSFLRFGDDLCEEILQYLSFEEKIKYECVCKQFKFNIYKRQNELQIVDKFHDLNDNNNALIAIKVLSKTKEKPVCKCGPKFLMSTNLNGSYLNKKKKTSDPVIENLLKKCYELKHIVIENIESTYERYREYKYIEEDRRMITYDKLFAIIAENCNNLLSLDCSKFGTKISDEIWQIFVFKRGNTLKSLTFQRRYYMESIRDETIRRMIQICPNITRINNIKLSQLIDINTDEILAPKLREIKIVSESKLVETKTFMEVFVERYLVAIKIFKIKINFQNDCIEFANSLSKLINLKKLSIDIQGFYGINELSLNECYVQLMKCINNFSKLEYLYLRNDRIPKSFINNKTLLSANLLKNCNELKYLKIETDLINDKFVCNIESCLPKLKHICIKTSFSLTDDTLNYLSQAKQLSIIDFDSPYVRELNFTDTGFVNILENCIAIKSFSFQYCNKITTVTIDKLVQIAKQRPKTSFKFKFLNHIKFNKPLQDRIKLENPSNLDIKFESLQFIPIGLPGCGHY